MESKYFISAFLEVESIDTGNEIARDLARVGNLFDTEEQARKVLHLLKYKIGRYAKILHNLRNKSVCSSSNTSFRTAEYTGIYATAEKDNSREDR